jgi:hypothetical protein
VKPADIDPHNFFTGNELLHDPYGYLAAVREECPRRREKHRLHIGLR